MKTRKIYAGLYEYKFPLHEYRIEYSNEPYAGYKRRSGMWHLYEVLGFSFEYQNSFATKSDAIWAMKRIQSRKNV